MSNIIFKGARNFRDLGNVNADGGKMASGKFYRSGHLYKFTKKSVVEFEKYGINTIVDLRTDKERTEKPDLVIPNIEYIAIPFFDEMTGGITHEKGAELKIVEKMPEMTDLYEIMVSDKCIGNIKKIMRVILDASANGKNVLFHCSEGKDRTGIISLLIYTMLGVSMDDIVNDYLVTNTYSYKKARKIFWSTRIVFFWDKNIARKLKAIFFCEKKFLDAAIDSMTKTFGSVMKFIIDGLGITEEEIETFKANNIVTA